MRDVYIVLSQTGTILSVLLKIFTGAKYNHSSFSTDGALNELYSFGRLNPYNPFVGGFVRESKNGGTFKRFRKTQICVLQTKVSKEKVEQMNRYFAQMYAQKKRYKYNYRGLLLAIFNKAFVSSTDYYCSEFVKHVLLKFGLDETLKNKKVIKPVDFLTLNGWNVVYTGLLSEYSQNIIA